MLALVLPLVGGANLELSGATTPRITFHDTTTHSTINAEVMAPAPGTLTVTTAASPGAAPVERLRIDAIGRIGVTQTNPTGALHIGNGAYCTAGFCDVLVKLQAYSTGNAVVQMLNSTGTAIWSAGYRDNGAGSGSYKIVSGDHMDSNNNLVLSTNGNVGIGTNSPRSRLHVAGHVKVNHQVTDPGLGVSVPLDVRANNNAATIVARLANEGLGASQSTILEMIDNRANQAGGVRLEAKNENGGGNDGSFRLYVRKNLAGWKKYLHVTRDGSFIFTNDDHNSDGRMVFDQGGRRHKIGSYFDTSGGCTADCSYWNVAVSTGSTDGSVHSSSLRVYSDRITAPNWASNSDRALKENITNISLGLAFIETIRPVQYTWKSSPGRTWAKVDELKFGFIAQELERTPMRAAVTGKEGEKTLAYTELVAPTVKAVQELSATVHSQQAQIAAQQAQLDAQHAQLDALREAVAALTAAATRVTA